MINAYSFFKVGFDKEGKKRIEDAFLTIRDIMDALEEIGDEETWGIRDELLRTNEYLQAFLDKVTF